ncbi:hypothetical protein [Streptomyces xiamenensis]
MRRRSLTQHEVLRIALGAVPLALLCSAVILLCSVVIAWRR